MLRAGERWGAYELVRPLGEGAFADVWLARHVHLLSRHAIKHLDPRWALHPGLRERFLAEGRILAQLRHPAIVPVTDLLDDGPDRLALVMEFVEGETLAHRLERGALAPAEAVRLAAEVAEGLHHAHEAGVVHRDVKPANIVLVPSEGRVRPVLLDFGVAKVLEAAAVEGRQGPGTRATTRLGTPQYMSPEQVEASHAVDRRADVYAVGAVLHEMLTGSPAVDGSTVTEILFHVTQGVRRPLSGFPPPLVAIVDRAMEVSPDARFPTARALAEALRALQDLPARPLRGTPPPTAARVVERIATQPTLAPSVGRPLAPLVGGLLVLGVGLAALSVALSGVSSPPNTSPPEATVVVEAAPPEPAPGAEPPPPAPLPQPVEPPKPPRPPAAPPTVAPSVRDAQALDEAWTELAPRLASCAPAEGTSSTWKLTVAVGPDGQVTSARARSTTEAPTVARCLEAEARTLRTRPLTASRTRTFTVRL